MCFMVIVGRCFSGSDLLARRVSEGLGYRLVDRDAVIERAGAWGMQPAQWRTALQPVPALRTCFGQDRGVVLAMLRAALAEEAVDSEVVYSGCEGFLLPRSAAPVLRIRLNVPVERRLAAVEQRLGLTRVAARRYIRSADRAQQRWVREIAGTGDEDPALYDLVINVDDGDFDTACHTIAAFSVGQTSLERGAEYRMAMADFALASRVEAVLKLMPGTAGLNTAVRADRGLVFLAAQRWSTRDREAIGRVVAGIRGVRRLVLVDWRPEADSSLRGVRHRLAVGWRLWAAGTAVCGLLAAGALLFKPSSSNTLNEVTSVTGVITDTRCRGKHDVFVDSEGSRCVRECVRFRSHVQYALFDGTRLYPLSDQGVGDQFAARLVTVAGRVNAGNNVLQVDSVKPTSETSGPVQF